MKKLFILLVIAGIAIYIMSNTVIQRMARAIQDWEDGVRDNKLTSGTISGDNFNPGNLKPYGFTYDGQIGIDTFGHAIFSSYQYGWNALIHQLRIAFTGESNVYSPHMTLYDFFSKYAEANSRQYAEFVASKLGVSPETQLRDLV